MAAKLKAHLDQQSPPELERFDKLASFMQRNRSIITPQTWPQIKKAAEQSGVAKPGELPDNPSPQQLQQMLYMPEMIQAYIKAQLTPYQASKLKIEQQKAETDAGYKASRIGQMGAGLGLREREVELKENPPEKSESPVKVRDAAERSVSRVFKWSDVKEEYESQAQHEISGQVTDKKVSHAKVLLKNTEAINKRARQLFEQDRQARVDRAIKARQAESGSTRTSGADRSTYYNTFKAALSGPMREQAIAHAKENDPEFIEKAQEEGLIE
jgi:hypothetical protein